MLYKTGYQILQLNNLQTLKNIFIYKKTYKQKQIITHININKMQKFLRKIKLEGYNLP